MSVSLREAHMHVQHHKTIEVLREDSHLYACFSMHKVAFHAEV